jgi:Zn-dependent protease with chaperone function
MKHIERRDTMYVKTAAALVAALVISTSSAALANTGFDVNIYTPSAQDNGMSAFAQVPSQARRAPVQGISPAEQLWFERASSPKNS